MNRNAFATIAILASAFLVSGCGASIELQRSDPDLASKFESSEFFLLVEDGSKSKPDNWDGNLNLIWTNDDKRAKIVAENIQMLRSDLEENGFVFVETQIDSSVVANLIFKSVRFDPTTGWITDDARITYLSTDSGKELGTVIADEVWVTPTVKAVFGALVKGSLELWGRTPVEEPK